MLMNLFGVINNRSLGMFNIVSIWINHPYPYVWWKRYYEGVESTSSSIFIFILPFSSLTHINILIFMFFSLFLQMKLTKNKRSLKF